MSGEICIDCEATVASDGFNERCEACREKYESNMEPADDPDAWSGGFADNH